MAKMEENKISEEGLFKSLKLEGIQGDSTHHTGKMRKLIYGINEVENEEEDSIGSKPTLGTRRIGGVVLKRIQLLQIVEEDNTVGLAFGLNSPGVPDGISLKIYKVIERDRVLEGEERYVSYMKGALGPDALAEDVSNFYFNHEDLLRSSKFDFAYLPKDHFHSLFTTGEDEVFIAGGTVTYSPHSSIKGKFFSLYITTRVSPSLEKILGTPPRAQFMTPCPPFWVPDSINNIIFK